MINEATIIITLDSQRNGEDNYEPLLIPSLAELTAANDSYQSVASVTSMSHNLQHSGAGLHVSCEHVTPTDNDSHEYLQVVDTDPEIVDRNTGTNGNNVYLQIVDSNTGTDDTEYLQVVESSEDTQINNYNSIR